MLSLRAICAIILAFLSLFLLRRKPVLNREATSPIDEKYQDEDDNISSPSPAALNGKPPAELPQSVTLSDVHLIGRDAWVLRMTHHVFTERHQGRHNVLIINEELEYHFTAEGIIEEFQIKYYESKIPVKAIHRVVPYRIIVFRKGSIVSEMGALSIGAGTATSCVVPRS